MQFEQASEYMMSKLSKELPAGLTYHNIEHTCDVYPAAETIAKLAGALGTEAEWNKLQLQFMENHRYFTKSAINLRQAAKEANMANIRSQLFNQTAE